MPAFTCANLAAVALPGLPIDVSAMTKREGWRGQRRAGVGGGTEYSLPARC